MSERANKSMVSLFRQESLEQKLEERAGGEIAKMTMPELIETRKRLIWCCHAAENDTFEKIALQGALAWLNGKIVDRMVEGQ